VIVRGRVELDGEVHALSIIFDLSERQEVREDVSGFRSWRASTDLRSEIASAMHGLTVRRVFDDGRAGPAIASARVSAKTGRVSFVSAGPLVASRYSR